MNFEIYCDESQPDIFWSKSPDKPRYLMIGGLWLPAELRSELKHSIAELKKRYGFHSEIKWHKVHAGREAFYRSLIDLFCSHGEELRFRCIAVEAVKVNMVKFHDNDCELGFYKFYYQLIKHWIDDFNDYRIFCDEKSNRVGERLKVLQRTLGCANVTSRIISVQALPSQEVALIQLVDFLLGMVSARMNSGLRPGGCKERLVQDLERRLVEGRPLTPTGKSEKKFNIFKIDLRGGW